MANQNGNFSQFEFIDQSGNLRIASASEVWIDLNINFLGVSNVRDPRWRILHPEDGVLVNDFDELAYKGTDGKIWFTRFHATIDYEHGLKDLCKIWLEHHIGGGGENRNNNEFAVVGGDGSHWLVSVSKLLSDRTSPVFTLTRQ